MYPSSKGIFDALFVAGKEKCPILTSIGYSLISVLKLLKSKLMHDPVQGRRYSLNLPYQPVKCTQFVVDLTRQ